MFARASALVSIVNDAYGGAKPRRLPTARRFLAISCTSKCLSQLSRAEERRGGDRFEAVGRNLIKG